MKAFQVNDKFDNVADIDFTDLRLMANAGGVTGTISIHIAGEGWKDITGEHGFNDFAEEFGFIIDIDED